MNGDAARAEGAEGSFLAWATGGAVVAACADLLVAVIVGLADPPAGGGISVRDFAVPLAGAAVLSSACSAASWGGRSVFLVAAGVVQTLLAGGIWFGAGELRGGFPPPLAACVVVHGLAAALAFAGAATLRREAAAGRPAGLAGPAAAVSENLESVLVAIVFALVIRHFAVEAYKIPTTSMAPTLLGDDFPRRGGDRVLVKKWDAFLSGPERWQIWVFRPPRDRTENYVKRVAGLPGDTVEVREGDLYIDGKVARKPPKTREDTWFPVWPRADGGKPEKDQLWQGEGFRPGESGAYVVSGAKERRLLRFNRRIGDSPSHTGMNEVGDVRLRFDVDGAEPGTQVLVRVAGRAGPIEVRIEGDGSQIHWKAGEGEGSAGLAAGLVRTVEVSFADLALEVLVNGESFRYENLDAAPAGKRVPFGVSFGVEKGGAHFRDVRLDRDVFYTESGKFTVPEGHYFFLGDNSSNSEDSRRWLGWETTEIATGRAFFSKDRPSTRDGVVRFRDRNGVQRTFDPSGVRISDGPVPMSFVPSADLHGRAFAVFWPPRWFTTTPGGRLRVLP